MDLLLACMVLFTLAIPMAMVGLLVRLTSPGPAIYWSDRVGRYNQIFRMPKFRSMRIDTPAVATHLLENPRQYLTPIGHFLRKSSLDELPQLWNVIKGDLSLIGPRPELPEMVKHYEQEIPFYGVRHMIRPGLSGWAQIHHEVPPHSVEGTKEKLSYDLYYIKHRSIWLDILIALKTIKTLSMRVGV